MGLMTAKEYRDSLRKLHTRVYMFGEKIDNWVDHPMIRPSINSVAMTYELAQDPQYKELMTATSHLTGKVVNRFTHIHRSSEDLIKKVKMQRLVGQKTASCFQRCVGMDAFNAVYSTTYEIDQKYGTTYHEKLKAFLMYIQEHDLVVDGAMTDPKGDRSSIISTHRLEKFLPLTERNILFFTVASGFSMIINNKLRDMLNAEQLMKHGVFHDEWCIWTAFFNGTVLYEDCVMAKYRRHSSAYTTYGNSAKTLLYSWIFDEVLGDDFSKKCDRIRYFLCKDGCITESAKKEWKFLARRRGEPGYLKRLFFPHRLRPSLSGEIALRILFLLNA